MVLDISRLIRLYETDNVKVPYQADSLKSAKVPDNKIKTQKISLLDDGKKGVVEYWRCPVPYEIADDVKVKQTIEEAIDYVSTVTDWKFREKRAGDKYYIRFIDGNECSSMVGQVGKYILGGPHEINTSRLCPLFSIVHEICHALGLKHTQERIDRDQYVNINTDNILPGKINNFDTQLEFQVGDYDFGSLMHYGAYDFSKNGQKVISVKDQTKLKCNMGQTYELSTDDIKTLNDIASRNGCSPSSKKPECDNTDLIFCNGGDNVMRLVSTIYVKTQFTHNGVPIYRSKYNLYDKYLYIIRVLPNKYITHEHYAIVRPKVQAGKDEQPMLDGAPILVYSELVDLYTSKWFSFDESADKWVLQENANIIVRDCNFPDLSGYTRDSETAYFWEWSAGKLAKYIILLLIVLVSLILGILVYLRYKIIIINSLNNLSINIRSFFSRQVLRFGGARPR